MPFSLPLPSSVQRLAFISDLHLDETLPKTLTHFIDYLPILSKKVDALFILGDLFEYWAGDDDKERGINSVVIQALVQATQQGLKIYFQHGNRDFLIGTDFAHITGSELLPESVILPIASEKILLLHGDTLCTDDLAYQQFRQQVRNLQWQQNFLMQPLAHRLAQIATLREHSEQEKQTKSMEIMDVNQKAVLSALQDAQCHKMIHGHTHRPATHRWEMDGQHYERWVLSDWNFDTSSPRGNALIIRENEWQLENF